MAKVTIVDPRRFSAQRFRGADEVPESARPAYDLTHLTPLGLRVRDRLSEPDRTLPSDRLAEATADIAARAEPQRSAWLRRYLQPPRIIAPARVATRLRTVSYGGARDVPQEVQFAAGAVDLANVVRVLYVEPTIDGAAASGAAHELRSIAVSTASSDLGHAVGEPQTLLSRSRSGGPIQLAGFVSTQVREGIGGARPVMLAVARPLDGTDNEFIVVDHDPASGAATALVIEGAPSPGRFGHVTPGLSWGVTGLGGRLLAVFVAEDATGAPQLVAGHLAITSSAARFMESDRAPVPRGETDSYLWFDICVDFQPALSQWVVATTVDSSAWEGRFNAVDSTGRFHRPEPFMPPSPTLWWPGGIESPHSGNGVRVHPVTGNVVFKAAHNTASGEVSADQRWTNQWDGIHPWDDANPPDTFPGSGPAAIARGGRWSVSPCLRAPWEFITTSADGYTEVVSQRVDGQPAIVVSPGRVFVSSGGGGNTGCHTVVRVDARRATAHVAAWRVGGFGVHVLGVGFVEDAFGG